MKYAFVSALIVVVFFYLGLFIYDCYFPEKENPQDVGQFESKAHDRLVKELESNASPKDSTHVEFISSIGPHEMANNTQHSNIILAGYSSEDSNKLHQQIEGYVKKYGTPAGLALSSYKIYQFSNKATKEDLVTMLQTKVGLESEFAEKTSEIVLKSVKARAVKTVAPAFSIACIVYELSQFDNSKSANTRLVIAVIVFLLVLILVWSLQEQGILKKN